MNLDLIKALYGNIGENATLTVTQKSNDFADYLIIKDKEKPDLSKVDKTDYYAKGKNKYGVIIASSEGAIRVQTIYYTLYKKFKAKKATNKDEYESNKALWQTLPWNIKYSIEADNIIKRKKDGDIKVLHCTRPHKTKYSTWKGWSTMNGTSRWAYTLEKALECCLRPVESYLYNNRLRIGGKENMTIVLESFDKPTNPKQPVYEKLIVEKFIEINLSRLKYVAPRRKSKKKITTKKRTTKS